HRHAGGDAGDAARHRAGRAPRPAQDSDRRLGTRRAGAVLLRGGAPLGLDRPWDPLPPGLGVQHAGHQRLPLAGRAPRPDRGRHDHGLLRLLARPDRLQRALRMAGPGRSSECALLGVLRLLPPGDRLHRLPAGQSDAAVQRAVDPLSRPDALPGLPGHALPVHTRDGHHLHPLDLHRALRARGRPCRQLLDRGPDERALPGLGHHGPEPGAAAPDAWQRGHRSLLRGGVCVSAILLLSSMALPILGLAFFLRGAFWSFGHVMTAVIGEVLPDYAMAKGDRLFAPVTGAVGTIAYPIAGWMYGLHVSMPFWSSALLMAIDMLVTVWVRAYFHANDLVGREDVDPVDGRRVFRAGGVNECGVVIEPGRPGDIQRATAAVGARPAGRKVVDPEFGPARGELPDGQLGPIGRPGRMV